MRVYVAGGSGELGRRLVPRLLERGHQVTATVRTPGRADAVRAAGAEPVVVDGLDAAAVREAVDRAAPDVIVHQMTALSAKPDFKHFDRWFAVTNRLRTEGTRHLLAAAEAAGVGRFVAQSFTGWNNARTGGPVKTEQDPLDSEPAKWQRESSAAIRFVEQAVTTAPLDGIALRYGLFYGPGASQSMVEVIRKRQFPLVGDGGGVWSWIHLDDAAAATVAALERGRAGVYNIVDDEPAAVSEWLPYLAESVGAKRPMRVPAWVARLLAGTAMVQWCTQARGASNLKAKHDLDWQPVWSSWRDGFRHALIEQPPTAEYGRDR
ncbi:NAD(P)-dependent oxidoreductase [Phytoactinopolyspora halotolerans]|uniref:NAD(P)-dependent oxidoreductase n=2 Tax=Phytoactinopolyspora halotolerans TaxID=1981512 RepID=A0A6L9SGH9_9ACTN|nr:NAD(P)-dependent oxidoreductase [Phytoactinopolyspora halotolerans]